MQAAGQAGTDSRHTSSCMHGQLASSTQHCKARPGLSQPLRHQLRCIHMSTYLSSNGLGGGCSKMTSAVPLPLHQQTGCRGATTPLTAEKDACQCCKKSAMHCSSRLCHCSAIHSVTILLGITVTIWCSIGVVQCSSAAGSSTRADDLRPSGGCQTGMQLKKHATQPYKASRSRVSVPC